MRKKAIARDEVRVEHYAVWTLPSGSFHRDTGQPIAHLWQSLLDQLKRPGEQAGAVGRVQVACRRRLPRHTSQLPPLRPPVLLSLSPSESVVLGQMRAGSAGSPHRGGGQGEIASACQSPRRPQLQDLRPANQGAARQQAILLGPLPGNRPSHARSPQTESNTSVNVASAAWATGLLRVPDRRRSQLMEEPKAAGISRTEPATTVKEASYDCQAPEVD